jgi:hypothetical protein
MTEKKTPGPKQEGAASPAPEAAEQENVEGAMEATVEAGPEGSEDAPARTKKRAANVKDHIGRQLRALYNEVASQPVPDRFMELLDRLEVKRGEE